MVLKYSTIIRHNLINEIIRMTSTMIRLCLENNKIMSNCQHTDITHNITDTNTHTKHYIGETYLHYVNIATVMLNPTPSLP